MNELVTVRHNDAFTDSIVIANGTDNQHHAVQQLIKKYEGMFTRWGNLEFTHLKCGKRGRPSKVYYLNEQQAYFLMTLLGNNEVVLKFKAELVDQFFKMKTLLVEKKTEGWQLARGQGKEMRRELTDVLKEYVELAESQGHHGTAKFAYSNFTKLIKKPFGTRDNAGAAQLVMIATVEHILAVTLQPLVKAGKDAKEIYCIAKQKVEALTGVMLPALPQ